jgi:hypothetical protein
MSNNKQSRIYQCIRLLSQGVNSSDIRDTIINTYEDEINELTEKVKRLKIIASALTNSKLKDTQEENLEKCYEALTVTNKENLILRREKNELENVVNSLLNRDMLQENETLKETNKNLLNIGKEIEEELNHYKEKYSKLKTKVNTIYGNSLVLGDISLEEASNLKKENEKLKQDKNKALFYLKKYISTTLVFSSCVDNAIEALE